MEEKINFCQEHNQILEESCFSCKKFLCSACISQNTHKRTRILSKFLLKNYKLKKVIGKSAKSTVYEVFNINGKGPFAVKLIENIDEKSYLSFQGKINEVIDIFPNIWHYQSSKYIIEEKIVIILMNLADESLNSWINSEIYQNNSQALSYFFEICKIIDFLNNQKKISHGNLKLKNFLLYKKEIYLTDFAVPNFPNYDTNIFIPPEILTNSTNNEFNEKCDIWFLGLIFHQILTRNKNPFWDKDDEDKEENKNLIKQNILNGELFVHPSINNQVFVKIIKDCLANDPCKRPTINQMIGFLSNEQIIFKFPIPHKADLPALANKYSLKDFSFAKFQFEPYDVFNKKFFECPIPAALSSNNFLSVSIISPKLIPRKVECGLSLENSQKLSFLFKNTTFFHEANIAGVSILINPPWYPFEYNFREQKGTESAKVLFQSIFENPAIQFIHLKLICKFKVIDYRSAVNLTTEESIAFGEVLKNSTNLKSLFLEFEGAEGALGITEYTCLQVVHGILMSNLKNVAFKIKGNRKNSFNTRRNKETYSIMKMLKNSKKFDCLKMFYE